jgi:hypothetical protein
VPRVGSTFSRDEDLLAHARLGGRTDESLRYRVLLENMNHQRIYESEWKPLQPIEPLARAVNVRLPLRQLEPGGYNLSVEIISDHGDSITLARPFAVDSAVP